MIIQKTFTNGLRLIINKIDSVYSVSVGVLVKTGSANESSQDNGISHFIEHTMFKGTTNRTAFEISDYIDRIGAQINAYTSKELTCYYTKSTSQYFKQTLEILSDMFFNSTFNEEELEKEKGVIIEEINMYEDSPEDMCLDLLAESKFGKKGLGRTILGPEKNIKKFTKKDIEKYMLKYYNADNVVISICGNVDIDCAIKNVEDFFSNRLKKRKSFKQAKTNNTLVNHLQKTKKIEQTHIAFSMDGLERKDKRNDALAIANYILGGGMSSRLFQAIREKMGLAYSVYSYNSSYRDCGVIEVYAGVNTDNRDKATKAIVDEIKLFKNNGITENEFLRGKEQIKSSLVFGMESTTTQMMLYGKNLLLLEEEFDFKTKLDEIENITKKDVEDVVNLLFNTDKMSTSTVGKLKTPLQI